MAATGRFVYQVEPRHIEIREHELPAVSAGGILARILRTNVCGSELHIWSGNHPVFRSGILGHEMLGEVLELGKGVTTDFAGAPLAIGDRIASTYFLTCRRCRACTRGDFNLCENAYANWSKQPDEYPYFHGTFATHYYIHPDQYFYRVPDGLDELAAAGANCALSQVLFALDRGALRGGETLVIQGAGGLGLNAAAVAKLAGAHVLVIDSVPERLEMARRFGADDTFVLDPGEAPQERAAKVAELTGGGADIVLEVSGSPAAFAEGPLLARPGGRYVVVGNVTPGRTAEVDPALFVRRQVSVVPALRYQPWFLKRSLDFLAQHAGTFPFHELVDDNYSLDDVEQALQDSSGRSVTRASIRCS